MPGCELQSDQKVNKDSGLSRQGMDSLVGGAIPEYTYLRVLENIANQLHKNEENPKTE